MRTRAHTDTHVSLSLQTEITHTCWWEQKAASWSAARLYNSTNNSIWKLPRICLGGGSPEWTNANVPICVYFTSEQCLLTLHAHFTLHNTAAQKNKNAAEWQVRIQLNLHTITWQAVCAVRADMHWSRLSRYAGFCHYRICKKEELHNFQCH